MMRKFFTCAMCALFLSSPVMAQSRYDRLFADEDKKEQPSYCYGSSCERDEDRRERTRTEDKAPEMKNSFQDQGTRKGSVGSMIQNQMQPR